MVSLIEIFFAKIPNLDVIATCNNILDAFEELKSKQVDLIFLDIQIPLLTGIEFLKPLQNPDFIYVNVNKKHYKVLVSSNP